MQETKLLKLELNAKQQHIKNLPLVLNSIDILRDKLMFEYRRAHSILFIL